MTYTPSLVWKLLADHQRRAQGAHMSPPEDRLGTRPPPLDEAPFASTSRLWADIETAMQNLPFQHAQILFMTVCLGEGSWRNGTKRYNWREKVGDYWGMTGGEVNKSVSGSIKEICDSLNRPTFNYEREADTVVENDTRLLPDLVDNADKGLWAKIKERRRS